MPVTLTAATMASPIAKNHVGDNVLTFNVNSGASKFGSISDVYLLGRIPNGSLVTDGAISFGIQKSAIQTFTMLVLGQDDGGTYTVLQTLRASGAQPSITANATTVQSYHLVNPSALFPKFRFRTIALIKFATLALNCTVGGSGTTSFSFQGFVRYVADGRAE
jgi:hypothetical protein